MPKNPEFRTNLDVERLGRVASTAKEILDWSAAKSRPGRYSVVANQVRVRDFVHTLDLLETVLTRFGVCSHLTSVALGEMDGTIEAGSLFWEFWQIDIEEFFAASLLELCYQLSVAWKRLDDFGKEEPAFEILHGGYKAPSRVLLARHKFTHFRADQFEDHELAEKYSILRRPYVLRDGRLEKELAKETMPRVAALIRSSVDEGDSYVQTFRSATVG